MIPPSYYQHKPRLDCYNEECIDTHYMCECGIVYHDRDTMNGCNHELIIACKCGVRYYNVIENGKEYNKPLNNNSLTYVNQTTPKGLKPQAW